MKNISISRLIVALIGISAAHLCAYEFKVRNYLNVPIRVELPLSAELKSAEIIEVPAKGEKSYNPQDWYVRYCLNHQNIKVAKEDTDFVKTPLMIAENFTQIVQEAAANNGKVQAVSGRNYGDFGLGCENISIVVIEDAKGNLFACKG